MKYRIQIAPTALRLLQDISDNRIKEKIRDRINDLAKEPDKQGKPLVGDLSGYRSVRAVGQRYRIIYKVEKRLIIVYVLALGIRKEGSKSDIYKLAKKLLDMGLVAPPSKSRSHPEKKSPKKS